MIEKVLQVDTWKCNAFQRNFVGIFYYVANYIFTCNGTKKAITVHWVNNKHFKPHL